MEPPCENSAYGLVWQKTETPRLHECILPLSESIIAQCISGRTCFFSVWQTYFPAFHACVSEGGAKSIMCSYNAVNGVPSCANGLFQNTVVRDEWGFDGYIVSGRHTLELLLYGV